MKEFEPEAQKVLLRFAMASGLQDASVNPELALADLKKLQSMAEAAGLPKEHRQLRREQAVALLKKTDWAAHRPLIIGVLCASVQGPEHDPRKVGSYLGPNCPRCVALLSGSSL